MKCLLCERFSLSHICSTCQNTFLTPSIYKRKLQNNIEVISFYKYRDIKDLLHTKHTELGFYIYKILANRSMKLFTDAFNFESKVVAIGIDDNVQSGYSHTAILSKSLSSKNIKPLFNKLRARNNNSYSGKSREFRLLNPRNFELKYFIQKYVILVDDIITTSSTLTQAIDILQKENKEVLFCLTLADASLK